MKNLYLGKTSKKTLLCVSDVVNGIEKRNYCEKDFYYFTNQDISISETFFKFFSYGLEFENIKFSIDINIFDGSTDYFFYGERISNDYVSWKYGDDNNVYSCYESFSNLLTKLCQDSNTEYGYGEIVKFYIRIENVKDNILM